MPSLILRLVTSDRMKFKAVPVYSNTPASLVFRIVPLVSFNAACPTPLLPAGKCSLAVGAIMLKPTFTGSVVLPITALLLVDTLAFFPIEMIFTRDVPVAILLSRVESYPICIQYWSIDDR